MVAVFCLSLFFFFKVDDSSLVLVVFSLFSSIPKMLLSFLWFFFFLKPFRKSTKKHFSFLQRVLIWCLCRPGQHSIGLKQVRLDGCLLFVCFDPIHSSMFPTARTFHARTVCKSFTRVCFWFNLVCLFVYPIIGFYTLYSSLVFFFSLSLLPPTGT